jgi:hypothetical protein
MQPNHENQAQDAEDAARIERWLELQLTRTDPQSRSVLAPLVNRSPVARFRLLQDVLKRKSALGSAARRLALVDQVRLSLELVRTDAVRGHSERTSAAVRPAVMRTRCCARRRADHGLGGRWRAPA